MAKRISLATEGRISVRRNLRQLARNFVVVASGIVLQAFAACAASAPLSLPEAYLGRWYYAGSSGGIAGDGMGDEAKGYIVLQSDNTIDRYAEDGVHLERSEFEVIRGPTIFSSKDQWILEHEGAGAEVIMVSEDGQTMSLSENAYDSFMRRYVRSR